MSSESKSSAFPDTVQPGIPRLPETPPLGWRRTKFGNHLFEEKRPVTLEDDSEYDLVTVKRARGGVIKRDAKLGRDISVKTQFEVKAGDFLISKRQIVHGACGLVPQELDGSTVSNEYAILRGKDSIDLNFLNHFSHSVFFQQTCFHSSIGVHIEKMIFKTAKWFNWEIDLPPLEEQRRITEILSTWDRAIETTEKLIANSQAQKKALMQQLLTGKKRLPGFDGEWKCITLGQIAKIYAGGTPSTSQEQYWGGNIPWMSSGEINLKRVNSVQGRITQMGLDNSSARMVPPNSILIALAGQGKTRGKVAINEIPLCTNQSVASIIPTDEAYFEYIFHNLDSRYEEIRSMSFGDGGRGGLNLRIIGSIKLPFPKRDEQQKIAQVLSFADIQTDTLTKKLLGLQQEKSALMQQLLTGKRRVKIEEIAA